MSKTDWKKIIAGVAPALATVLGGPLAGGAVKVLADQIAGGSTGNQQEDEMRVAGVLSGGLTPELQGLILKADQEVKIALIQAGVREKEIAADLDKVAIADTSDARRTHAGNGDVLSLAVCVLLTWAVLTGGTLWGLFALMQGEITVKDVSLVGIIFTLLGTTLGYVSNSAQQVISFYFGTSRGSMTKTDIMSEALRQAAPK